MKMNKPRFEQLCESKTNKGYLYIIKLSDNTESFYKIGITSNEDISIRINQIQSYYKVELIQAFSHPCSNLIMDIESKLLSLEEKYKPKCEFDGYSECVKDIKNSLGFLDTLDWIRDFETHELIRKETREKTRIKGKQYDFGKLTKEYATYKLTMLQNPTGSPAWLKAKEVCDEIEQDPALIDIVEYVKAFGINGVLNSTRPSVTLSKNRIKKSLEKHDNKVKSNIVEILKNEFSVGDVIKSGDIKQILQDVFDKHGITGISPKRSLLTEVFDVKSSTITENGKHVSVIKLQEKQ